MDVTARLWTVDKEKALGYKGLWMLLDVAR